MLPITVEKYVEEEFHKYVNNDGECTIQECEELKTIYDKAQTLVHYSHKLSEGKFMLVDIQGASYKLYDPEIAT